MKVYVYPADRWACGHYRLIWPAVALQRQGHDVVVVDPSDRGIAVQLDNRGGVSRITYPADADVMVFQRITNRYMAEGIGHLVRSGVAVVVDIDDDLAAIHPANGAWRLYHPDWRRYNPAGRGLNTWTNLGLACQSATLVTVSTDALAGRYAPHGRVRVLRNRIPAAFLHLPHDDSGVIGWPSSYHSHPNDPEAVGNAIARLVREGATFRVFGEPSGTGAAFGLPTDPDGPGSVEFGDYPATVAREIGVGIVPLADTRFNAAKSHLTGLTLSALGVPWVGSRRAEYLWLHALGAGVLAGRPKDWYRALRGLLDDPGRRRELSEAGRRAAAGLTIEGGAYLWLEAWMDARRIADRRGHKQPPRRTPGRPDPKRPTPKWQGTQARSAVS